MTNPYFTNTIDLLEATRARASDVESNFSAVEAGFDGVNVDMLTKAPLASPALTGTPTTTTPSTGDTSTRIANMAALQAAINAAAAINLPSTVGKNGQWLQANPTTAIPGWATLPSLNVAHNNNFAVNQRGVSGTVTLSAGAYGHDRWKAGASGCTYTFAASAGITTLTISAGTLTQVLDGTDLRSGTYAVSWSGTAQARLNGGSYGASGITATLTGGSNATLEFATGTVSLVQVQAGSSAPTASVRPLHEDLLICQRYLPVSSEPNLLGHFYGASSAYIHTKFTTPARAAPSGLLLTGALSTYNLGNSSLTYFDLTSGTVAYTTATTTGATFSAAIASGSPFSANTPAVLNITGSNKILWTGAEL